MIYLLLIPAISLLILAVLAWRAPHGWQDEKGFHLGQEPYQERNDPTPVVQAVSRTRPARRNHGSHRKAA